MRYQPGQQLWTASEVAWAFNRLTSAGDESLKALKRLGEGLGALGALYASIRSKSRLETKRLICESVLARRMGFTPPQWD